MRFQKKLYLVADLLEIDGVVFKVIAQDFQKELETRTNNPHWALTYKFIPHYVIAGTVAGSKLENAMLHDIEIIDEDEFEKLLKNKKSNQE